MSLIVGLFVLVIAISFLCSMLEAVFLSVSPAYASMLVKSGKKSGRLWEHLKENIDKPIAAILTLNTISHTIGAAAIGGLVQQHYGNEAVTIASIALTIGILVLSEILPKIIGATFWKPLAPVSAYTIQALIFLLYPFVKASQAVGRLFQRPDAATTSREEMIATAELGADEGTLHEKESAIIRNLLMLNSIYVSDIMTPRSVMFALDGDMTVEEVAGKYKPIRFSRIPVYMDSLDNVIGLTHRYKILEALSADQHQTQLKDIATEIQSVSETMPVRVLIDLLIRRKEHLALAVDEYGVVTGIVTLEDAIETLLGVEIVDEFDTITDMRQHALEQWKIRKNQIRKPLT